MKVLITSPSLDEQENVSGISTMISNIIDSGSCEFVHFRAGRKDGGKFDLGWLLTQVKLPFAFRRAIRKAKPDLIHVNTSFEPRAIIRDLVLVKSARRRPVILHIHGGRFITRDFENSTLASLAEKLLRSASRVIVLSDVEADALSKRTTDLDISVLPNAVATTTYAETEREWTDKNILYLGRLHESKGLSDIVESCRILAGQGFKFRFTCYGTGPDQQHFVQSMTELLGDRFRYGGVVSGSEKVAVLEGADILLMPSKFEGLPLSLLEAMAAGCVPIVSDRGSIPTVVEEGRNGFLVEPGDITQIVGKLKFLLSEGSTGWNQLRRNARQTIFQSYDLADYLKRLELVYAEVGRVDAARPRSGVKR